MMDGKGRLVSIFILYLCSTTFADPVIPPGLYETNFHALVSASMDTCDMKIKITDAKFYTPKKLSPTNIASVPTNLSPSNVLGPAGLKGDAGSKGAPGSKGERGLKGDKGESGSKGENGLMGISGAKGDPGPMGERGEQGLRGEKGSKGDAGKHGFEGPAGLKGEAGSKGATGLKGERGLKGDKGEPGSKGENGLMGISGAKGDPGPMGERGEQGLRGEKGSKGDAGERGFEGKLGPMGVAGPPGEKGNVGDTGYKGEPGSKGEIGLKGEKGDIGPAGKDCSRDEMRGPEEDNKYLGTSKNPATSCAQLSSDGIYTINPSNPFTINCTGEELMCLVKKDSEIDPEEKSINFSNEPFWLHPDFVDLYGIQGSQMTYLLSQSTGVRQTLTYHCFNTEVIPSKNPSNALLLYLWNGQLVGNNATSESPIFYEVYEDTCNTSTNEWKSATIKMTTEFTHHLPVVDIYIKDIRKEKQQAALELVELCFTYHKPTSP